MQSAAASGGWRKGAEGGRGMRADFMPRCLAIALPLAHRACPSEPMNHRVCNKIYKAYGMIF